MSKPPSQHVVRALGALHRGNVPTQNFNPGVVRKLMHEDWAEPVSGPAINQRAKPGDTIQYLRLMPGGREAYAKFRG